MKLSNYFESKLSQSIKEAEKKEKFYINYINEMGVSRFITEEMYDVFKRIFKKFNVEVTPKNNFLTSRRFVFKVAYSQLDQIVEVIRSNKYFNSIMKKDDSQFYIFQEYNKNKPYYQIKYYSTFKKG